MKRPKGYRAVSAREINDMTYLERKLLLSVCYRNNRFLCQCIGIYDFEVKGFDGYYLVSWGDGDGNPDFEIKSLDELIHDSGDDGEYTYGLFKKL